MNKLGVLHRVCWPTAALLRGHWRSGATIRIGNAIWRAVSAERIVPIARRQKCTWRIAPDNLLIERVSHGQIRVAHRLNVNTAWAFIESQSRAVDLNAASGFTAVTEFKFVWQCESINATGVPPVNPTVCTKGRFKLGIDRRRTSTIMACLTWSATVTKQAFLASAVAEHLGPKTSRCQSVGEAVLDFLSRFELPHRVSRHIL